jgi:hypothetical protein
MYVFLAISTLIFLWILWIFAYYSLFVKREGLDATSQTVVTASGPTTFSTTAGGTSDPSGNQRYDPNNYNTQYHDTLDTILKDGNGSDGTPVGLNSYYALDTSGNPVLITKTASQSNSTYHVPGTYVYGPSTYVPNYEDSVFLSKTSRQPSYSKLYNTGAMQAGFCSQYAASLPDIERVCNATDLDKCGSTSCCVLLGGSKCVAGNENGPTMKTNYSDKFIQDPTYYYFQGKCFGNCKTGV